MMLAVMSALRKISWEMKQRETEEGGFNLEGEQGRVSDMVTEEQIKKSSHGS